MNLRTVLAQLLDVAFPAKGPSARTRLIDELMAHEHTPESAVYDAILKCLNGEARFAYRDHHIRSAIHALKYDGDQRVATWCAQQSHAVLTTIIGTSCTKKLVVVPIPITFSRHLGRGYNQSELIARALVDLFPQHLALNTTTLIRSSFAQSQTRARTRSERAKNIRDAFEIFAPETIAGRDVLIVDDVITTGATIREAARAMRAAGARSVRCFAIAH